MKQQLFEVVFMNEASDFMDTLRHNRKQRYTTTSERWQMEWEIGNFSKKLTAQIYGNLEHYTMAYNTVSWRFGMKNMKG